MAVDEGARFQGIRYHAHAWPRDKEAWKMLGNTMSGNVISRALTLILNTIQPNWRLQDMWTSGDAQEELTKDALKPVIAAHSLAAARCLRDWRTALDHAVETQIRRAQIREQVRSSLTHLWSGHVPVLRRV